MIIYWVIALFLIILSFFKNKRFLMLSFFILLFVAGLRSIEIGTDTSNYAMFFLAGEDMTSYYKAFEYGWTYLNLFVYKLGLDYQWIIFLSSCFFLLPLYGGIYKQSKKPLFSVCLSYLLFYYCYSFNITRQMIAVAIVLYGYQYIIQRNILKYSLTILLAFCFHSSVFIALPIYYINKIKLSPVIACSLLVSTFLLGSTNIKFLLLFLSSIVGNYEEYIHALVSNGETVFSASRMLLNVFFAFIICVADRNNIYLKIIFVGIMMMNLLAIQPAIARISYYFVAAQVIFYPNMDLKYLKKYRPLIKLSVYLYALAVFSSLY